VKIIPQGTQIVGLQAQLTKSGGGLHLAVSEQQKESVLVVIESVGPDVVGYKPNDLVLPHHMNHAYFRGGVGHRVMFDQKEILAVITDVPLDQLEIKGTSQNGTASSSAGASA